MPRPARVSENEVKRYARRSIRNWPTLYKSYSAVLLSVFGFGSGHRWKGGVIVCEYDDDAKEHPNFLTVEEEYAHRMEQEWRDKTRLAKYGSDESKSRAYCPINQHTHDMFWRLAQDRVDENIAAVENIEQMLADCSPPEFIHPFNFDYCLIANLPDDIRPAWLDAAELVANILIECEKSVFISQYEQEVDKEELPVLDKETWTKLMNMIDADKPARDFNQLQAEAQQRKVDSYRHNENAIATNQAIGRQALQRIAEIRASRLV